MFSIHGVDKIAMACGCLAIRRPHRLKTVPQWGTNTLNAGIKIQAQRQGVETRLKMGQKLIFSDGSEGHYRHQKASPSRTNGAWLTVSLFSSFNAWIHPLPLSPSFLSIALLSKKFPSFLIIFLPLSYYSSLLCPHLHF